MERLTAKNKHGKPIIKDWPNYMEFDIINRLAAIEDILGDEYDLNRLRELVEADREGRCVVLPCKIGDTVWTLLPECGKYFVREVGFSVSMFNHIDETVFLTRADAEAALKAREALDDGNE